MYIQNCARKFFLLEKRTISAYCAEMAAARYSSDILQMFYGPIPREERINLPEPLAHEVHALYDGFQISQNYFEEWLRVWRMGISEGSSRLQGERALEELLREDFLQAERDQPCSATRGLSEAIQSLPAELREMILKDFIALKIKVKKALGWGGVQDYTRLVIIIKEKIKISGFIKKSKASRVSKFNMKN